MVTENKLTAIIVEDEPQAQQILKRYLNKYCEQVEIVGIAASSNEAYDIIVRKKPKILFLDVEISNVDSPETSFDLLKRIPKYAFETIFVSAFDHYAIPAFKCYALDYLLKPVNIDELITSVKKAEELLALKATNERLAYFINSIQNPKKNIEQISIPTEEGYDFVTVAHIMYCKAKERCTEIFLADQTSFLSSQNLKHFTDILEGDEFIQVHRSFLVNLKFIKKYNKGSGGTIILKNEDRIPVSRRRKNNFLETLNSI